MIKLLSLKSTRHILTKSIFFICIVLILCIISSNSYAQNKKIAIFGSSVANGFGDTTTNGGYSGFIKKLLEKRGWTVVNVSKGGDNTIKIMPRYSGQLLPEKAKYVILGLSLGNEGIFSSSETTRNRVLEQYRSGMLRLITMCREDGMIPYITNCYARNDFESPHYEATKRMNLIINTWDVPSMNALGTIDNGKGNWVEGFSYDKLHPNVLGHKEIFFAFVPSIFDAMEAGKKVPYKVKRTNYLHLVNNSSSSPLTYTPEDTIPSFAVSFLVKSSSFGTIAAVAGAKNGCGIAFVNNKIQYLSNSGVQLSGDTTQTNNGWIYVVLSHQWASGTTSLYVNGSLCGQTKEKTDFKQFILGGNGDNQKLPFSIKEAKFKDLLIYRSSLNSDEAKALYYDQLLQSSLEIYAPFNDLVYNNGSATNNFAQSLSRLMINSTGLTMEQE
jgi:lysophospholipase L1-like esterase